MAYEVRISDWSSDVCSSDLIVTREEWLRDDAVEFFKSIGEDYKAEIIASIPSNEPISLYREGDFIDLCRGPHVPSTGKLKVFKLMIVAGAYWRGDSTKDRKGVVSGKSVAVRVGYGGRRDIQNNRLEKVHD